MRKPDSKLIKRGISLALALLLLGFGGDLVSLFVIQVVKGEEYKSKAQLQQLSDTEISAKRGTIYDSQMNVLAQSATAWLVYLNPSRLAYDDETEEDERLKREKKTQAIRDNLPGLLDISAERLEKAIAQSDYGYVKLKGEVEYEDKELVKQFINDNGLYGIVNIDEDTKRYYPYGSYASAILGFTGADDVGRSGLELKYDSTLTGVSGRRITAKNAEADAMPNQYETVYDAKQGTSVVTTIDSVIQYTLEKGLDQARVDYNASGAYGVVMKVDTGAIMAMASMPDFDLNSPSTITDEETLKALDAIEDEEERASAYNNALYSMWRNKAISDTYEPGSVFKTVTLSAALEDGAITPSFTYSCGGSITVAGNRISCHRHSGHGTQDVEHGLMNSCNPFFITVGQKLGSASFYKYFEAFGFTEKTGIDLPGEAAPAANVTYYTGDRLGISELSSCAFGQTFQISALQMLNAVCCIANGGYLMTPHVVAAMLDEEGNTLYTAEPEVKRQVISKTTSDTVISMMESVVASGTGKNAYIAGYRVCGKTGTSEKLTKDGEYIASFVGFAPANDPQIAVLIVIDEPHAAVISGGGMAAPVASEVLEQSLKYLNVEPMYTDEELAKLSASAPSVTGVSVSEAKSQLQKSGFVARVVGDGDTVLVQNPSSGQTLPKNGVVILYTESSKTSEMAQVPDLTGLSISEANRAAVNAGFNISISGTSLESEVASYRQSIDAGTQAELGTIITVYFKTDTGVADF